MSCIVIKQTIVFTSGIFCGQITERYINVYKRNRIVPVSGSGYRLIKEEVVSAYKAKG